ncbi:MAG: SOS response-associated peptidase [Actinomycetota bacterium]|nr:SOS response-associated peptidase [Actinomycetota bacterium]
MCGRYAASNNPDDLEVEFEAILADDTPRMPAHYNVAPTDPVYAVRTRKPKENDSQPYRELTVVNWGLVPSWAKDAKIGSKMFNARVESLTDKPAFRKAFERRRALIPADGWYEWMVTGTGGKGAAKQPYFMTPQDGSVLAFAGLWEIWGSKPDLLLTCTVITIPAVGPLGEIHHRMPFVLPRRRWGAWLDPAEQDPAGLLEPTPLDLVNTLERRPVGAAVGNVKNNGPELIARLDPGRADQEQAQQLSFDNPG